MSTPSENTVPVSSVAASGDYWIDNLIKSVKWGGGTGTPVTLTYSFPRDPGTDAWTWSTEAYGATEGNGEPWSYSAAGLTSTEQTTVVNALSAWSSVANIQFNEVSDTANTAGDLRFAWTDTPNTDYQAWSYSPSTSPRAGDVWLRTRQRRRQRRRRSRCWHGSRQCGHCHGGRQLWATLARSPIRPIFAEPWGETIVTP